jgi:hypothetical protein
MTPRRPIRSREDSLEEPLPLWHTTIGLLGVIYDSQLAEILKNLTRNRWILLLFDR